MNLSTAFHPQIDVQAERTIQSLEYMSRACIIDFKGNRDKYLPLVEFTNNYHSSVSMAPYQALYSRRCSSPIGWFELGESSVLGPYLIYKTLKKVHIIRNRLKTAYSKKMSYADHRGRELEFEEGYKVYLKIYLRKGCDIWQER